EKRRFIMRRLLVACLAVSLVSAWGCSNKSSSGGPGATHPDNKKITGGPKNETFTVKAPATTTSLKQDEQKEVKISVDRSKDLKQDIKVTLSANDKGIILTPSTHTVKASEGDLDTSFNIGIKAAKDAKVGEYVVTVKA